MTEPSTPPSNRSGTPPRRDSSSIERLLPAVYDELRTLAARQLRRERNDHTLDATALVHEAYMRLAGSDVDWQGRAQLLAYAACAMRRVLVEHARARAASKRGGDRDRVTWVESRAGDLGAPVDVLALSDALERLARLNPRQAMVVELRFLGGLSLDEIAAVLERHRDTIKNDWRLARAWLLRDLSDGSTNGLAGTPRAD